MENSVSKPISIRLTEPVEWQGQKITELSLRRPKVRDLRIMEETATTKPGQLDQGAAMVALLTGIPAEAIEELDAADFTKVSEAIAGFFGKGVAPETGVA